MGLFLVLTIFFALLAGIAVPLGLFTGYRFIRLRQETFPTISFIWIIGLGSVLIIAAANRNWNSIGLVDAQYAGTQLSSWISRVFTLAAVALAVIELIRHGRINTRSQQRGASALWLAFILCFIAWLVSTFAGTKPDFQHAALYSVLLLTAIYLQPAIPINEVIKQAKGVIAVMLYLSFLALLVRPDMVIEHNYHGLIPGVNFRLHGLTTHANSLGPLAVVYLLLEFWLPSRQFWRVVNGLVAVVVLLLAQSKTGWIAAMSAGLVLYLVHIRTEATNEKSIRTNSASLALATILLIVVPVALLGMLLFGDPFQHIGNFLQNRLPGITTFTGRDVIWEITLKEWWANPLFGYGPTLWDIDYRIAHGQLEAGQAHNQFVQTLGDSGLLGLLALLSYLMMLFYYAMKYTKESKGVLLALVLVLLLRCFTESPFRLIVFLEPAFLTHLILFTLLVMMQRSDKNCSQQDRENVIKCA